MVMTNGIITIYSRGFDKGFSLKFCGGSSVRHETSEEGRWAHRPKRWKYNNEDGDKSPNIQIDKNLLATSNKRKKTSFIDLNLL